MSRVLDLRRLLGRCLGGISTTSPVSCLGFETVHCLSPDNKSQLKLTPPFNLPLGMPLNCTKATYGEDNPG